MLPVQRGSLGRADCIDGESRGGRGRDDRRSHVERSDAIKLEPSLINDLPVTRLFWLNFRPWHSLQARHWYGSIQHLSMYVYEYLCALHC